MTRDELKIRTRQVIDYIPALMERDDGWSQIESILYEILTELDDEDGGYHTGTPTETGWYLLHYPKSEEQPYELAQWDGEHFVAVKPFHAIIVRIEADTVPFWRRLRKER